MGFGKTIYDAEEIIHMAAIFDSKYWLNWGPKFVNIPNLAVQTLCNITYLPVPSTITARQIRLWLIQNNILLSQVDQVIDNILDITMRETTRVEWEYALHTPRGIIPCLLL